MKPFVTCLLFLSIVFSGQTWAQEKPSKGETGSTSTKVELTPEETGWWKQVEEAANEAKNAAKTLEAKISQYKEAHKVDNRAEAMARMPADLIENYKEAKDRFRRILSQGVEKKFRTPIDLARPRVIWAPTPTYTNEGRNNRACGKVTLKVAVGTDGVVESTTVLKSASYTCPSIFSSTSPKEDPSAPPIGNGLENAAIDAAKEMIFFPAIKDQFFVSATAKVEIFFNIA